MFEFIGTIAESRLIPSSDNLKRYTAEELAELVVLYVCGLYILYSFKETKHTAEAYARRTTQYGVRWDRWQASGTDLYVMLYGLKSDKAILKDQAASDTFKRRMGFGEAALAKWLREMTSGNIHNMDHRTLFTRLDSNFKISNSSIRAVRRMVMDWDHIDGHDRRLTMTRLLQLIKARAPKSEIMNDLRQLASRHSLEIVGACDKDTGEGCAGDYEPHDGKMSKSTSTLVALAGIAAGLAVSNALHKKKTDESATSGATGSASVASAPTAIGGIGVGFDPNGDRGIYQDAKKKKPVVLRR